MPVVLGLIAYVWIVLIVLLILNIKIRQVMKRGVADIDALSASVEASFDKLLDSVDGSFARLDATFERIDRRMVARSGGFGAEWNLSLDDDGCIVGGWAY